MEALRILTQVHRQTLHPCFRFNFFFRFAPILHPATYTVAVALNVRDTLPTDPEHVGTVDCRALADKMDAGPLIEQIALIEWLEHRRRHSAASDSAD